MTQRVALVLSIVLTLAVGAGVVAGRDRLFVPERVTNAATTTSAAVQPASEKPAGQLTRTSPRVVTITLPPRSSSASTQTRSERSFERDEDDHGRGDGEGYEHNGEYDDD